MDPAARTTPLALWRLHANTEVGSTVPVDARLDTPARRTRWTDLVAGAGFRIDTPRRPEMLTRERSLADTVGPGMRILVCGLNPSPRAADTGVGFHSPGNRFWPAARSAGLLDRDRDPLDALLRHGVGMTDLVKRVTARAADLHREEYRTGVERVTALVRWLRPDVTCFVGLAGWRAAVDRHATAGWQTKGFAGRAVYVMPSTSGLNARVPLAELVEHLRAVRLRAGPGASQGSGARRGTTR